MRRSISTRALWTAYAAYLVWAFTVLVGAVVTASGQSQPSGWLMTEAEMRRHNEWLDRQMAAGGIDVMGSMFGERRPSVRTPPVFVPRQFPVLLRDPPTRAQVDLGHQLFFEKRLSAPTVVNGQLVHTLACADCHRPEAGFAEPLNRSLGIIRNNGTRPVNGRNAPTLINASYSPVQFIDGRAEGMQNQALQPIVNPIEMGNQSEADVLNRLRRIPGYVQMFTAAYGPKQNGGSVIDRDRFGHAFWAFQSTLLSFDAPVDRRTQGAIHALSADEEAGYGLFVKDGCTRCHQPPFYAGIVYDPATRRTVQGTTQQGGYRAIFANNGMEWATHGPGVAEQMDRGRAGVAGVPDQQGTIRAFKVPTLRELTRTAPYGHRGQFPTTRSVLDGYNRGWTRPDGTRDPFLDPGIRPLGHNEEQLACLSLFLERAMMSDSYPLVVAPALPP